MTLLYSDLLLPSEVSVLKMGSLKICDFCIQKPEISTGEMT